MPQSAKQETSAPRGNGRPGRVVSPDFRIGDLCIALGDYLEEEQIRDVYRAYLFSADAHADQHRKSGEPYISHPVAVAGILAEQRLDPPSIVAALLHDVIEDTGTSKERVTELFGEEVAELVDGVSKLTELHFESQAEAQAENFRKMLLAMVRDIRVVLIKLADRLHNMRTLGAMPPHKRRRIARETLEIYAPIAARLGMNQVRLELEDLGFEAYYPMRYRVLRNSVKKARGHRGEILGKIDTAIRRGLHQEGIDARTAAREKHLYGIYRKMKNKDLPFNEVFDVYAFRIVVDKVDTCYRVLGAMHNLYKPLPGRFKDYIAIPKANGYQSLHTVLFGPYGVPIEVQIRTEAMNQVAEAGIAAHWKYKTGDTGGSPQERARAWLRELLEMQKSAGNSLEFLESVKIDLFPDEVYVFTPNGEILELPRGATAVDFAYSVHTDVGNTCVAAKINRRLMPLRTPLMNGQTVEIINAQGASPNPAWLNFVVTAKARTNIRHYLKNLRRAEAITLGRRMLEKELSSYNLTIESLAPGRLAALLEETGLESLEDLLADIGLANRMAPLVARRLVPQKEERPVDLRDGEHRRPLAIKGTEGMVVNYAKCCHPIPGDPVVGFITSGRGIVIHNEACRNIAEHRDRAERWLEVQWEPDMEGDFHVEIRVEVANRRGVLATLAATISELDSNIENVGMEERDGLTTTLTFIITVHHRDHLAAILRRLRAHRSVLRIYRSKG